MTYLRLKTYYKVFVFVHYHMKIYEILVYDSIEMQKIIQLYLTEKKNFLKLFTYEVLMRSH